MCLFYRVESQLYRDGKSRNLRQKITKLWHFEPTRVSRNGVIGGNLTAAKEC